MRVRKFDLGSWVRGREKGFEVDGVLYLVSFLPMYRYNFALSYNRFPDPPLACACCATRPWSES